MATNTSTLPTQWVLDRLASLSKSVKELGNSDDSAECILPQISDMLACLQDLIKDPNSALTTDGHLQLTSIDRTVATFKLSIPAPVDAATSELKLLTPAPQVPAFLRMSPSCSLWISLP